MLTGIAIIIVRESNGIVYAMVSLVVTVMKLKGGIVSPVLMNIDSNGVG